MAGTLDREGFESGNSLDPSKKVLTASWGLHRENPLLSNPSPPEEGPGNPETPLGRIERFRYHLDLNCMGRMGPHEARITGRLNALVVGAQSAAQ